jgi:hypothetical protein
MKNYTLHYDVVSDASLAGCLNFPTAAIHSSVAVMVVKQAKKRFLLHHMLGHYLENRSKHLQNETLVIVRKTLNKVIGAVTEYHVFVAVKTHISDEKIKRVDKC